MTAFLWFTAIILLLLNIVSFWRLIKQSPKGWLAEWDQVDMSHAAMQAFYALSGLMLFYTLSVMSYAPVLTWLGAAIVVDTLLFLFYVRRSKSPGLLDRYYRHGLGLYVSGVVQIVFLALVVWLLA